MDPLLRFSHVTKSFETPSGRSVTAIEDIELQVEERSFVSIIGPSGCGKTTLLRLAAGLALPSAGSVTYRGAAVRAPDRRRGMVFQAYNAFPWLSVAENIAFGINGVADDARRERVRTWLAATGLTEFANAYPKTLSGGMQQRLALARTMIVEPELLLLDEPFGALDEPNRRAMQELLVRTVERAGCAVMFVTHDIREAVLLSDRVVVLSPRPGRIFRTYEPGLPRPRIHDSSLSARVAALHEAIVADFPRGADP